MIDSKKTYKHFLRQDRYALGVPNSSFGFLIRYIFNPNVIWEFQKQLRRLEYIKNCKKSFFYKIVYVIYKIKFKRISLKLGFSIPENVFGPGLSIAHYGTIVVNHNARIGKNCRIHPSTCIGASGGNSHAPKIGDNVYIAPGAKIYGAIKIANNVKIAANAVVNRSICDENVVVAGVPAVVVKKLAD